MIEVSDIAIPWMLILAGEAFSGTFCGLVARWTGIGMLAWLIGTT